MTTGTTQYGHAQYIGGVGVERGCKMLAEEAEKAGMFT